MMRTFIKKTSPNFFHLNKNTSKKLFICIEEMKDYLQTIFFDGPTFKMFFSLCKNFISTLLTIKPSISLIFLTWIMKAAADEGFVLHNGKAPAAKDYCHLFKNCEQGYLTYNNTLNYDFYITVNTLNSEFNDLAASVANCLNVNTIAELLIRNIDVSEDNTLDCNIDNLQMAYFNNLFIRLGASNITTDSCTHITSDFTTVLQECDAKISNTTDSQDAHSSRFNTKQAITTGVLMSLLFYFFSILVFFNFKTKPISQPEVKETKAFAGLH